MYIVSFIFFILLAISVSKLSLAKLFMGLAVGAFFFLIGQYYRADAYNKAVESKVNLAPWKRIKFQ
jgi:positive regulator of sigma E activity